MSSFDNIESRVVLNNTLKGNTINDEYLLNSENNRLTVYPIKNNHIWESYKKQQAAFWTAEEIDFSKDYNDFNKLLFPVPVLPTK